MYGIDETQQIMFDETTAMNMQGMGYNGMGGVTSMGFGLGMGLDGTYPILSPSRASPRSQGSADNGERFSRKVFVGGLPPDIDEGKHLLMCCIGAYQKFNSNSLGNFSGLIFFFC